MLPTLAVLLEDLNRAKTKAARRSHLERAVAVLLRDPDQGVALARLVGRADQPSDVDGPVVDLLVAVLDNARMAQENGRKAGAVFLDAMAAAVDAMAARGELGMGGTYLLTQAWVRAGLKPPGGLSEISEDSLDGDPMSLADIEGQTDQMLSELLQQVDGNITALPMVLAELLPTIPNQARPMLVQVMASRQGPVGGYLARAWLLDAAPDLRLAAVYGLEGRLTRGDLEADLLADLPILRSWLPADPARDRLDALLKQVLRGERVGASAGEAPTWAVEEVIASLPDGVGAQSLAISLKSGRKRMVAMLLLKHGFGVKEAYLVPGTASDVRQMLAMLRAEVGGIAVPPAFLSTVLALALAEGLEQGRPPAAGLIDVVKACGLPPLRPEVRSAGQILQDLVAERGLSSMSSPARKALVADGESWIAAFPVFANWFEDNDEVAALLDAKRTEAARGKALWTWLESRRAYWGQQIARTALLLDATRDPLADSVIFAGLAVIDGRTLKEIPIMRAIHATTLEAWGMRDDSLDGPGFLPAAAVAAPLPEKKGELDKFLKRAPVSGAWVDGFVMAVSLAPKEIGPDKWLNHLLPLILPALDPRGLQRMLDLILGRYQAAIAVSGAGKEAMAAALRAMPPAGLADWAAGFTEGADVFRASWPKKSLAVTDQSIIQGIARLAKDAGEAQRMLTVLGSWLADRRKQL